MSQTGRKSKLPAHPKYKVAAIQFEPVFGDKARNVDLLVDMVSQAAEEGAKLIVLPEMATTGYCWLDRAEVSPMVEPVPGPTTDSLGAVARAHGCYIAVGMAEVDPQTNVYYDSLAFLGTDGVIGTYRKTHANIADPRWAADGDLGFPVWETEIGNIAGLICMDACYSEPARIAALKGADVIMLPANWLDIKAPSPLWMSMAFENGVYVIAADRWGLERGLQFSGGSCILDPDGTIQARRDTEDGIVYGWVDIARARDKSVDQCGGTDKLADRRPREYANLLLNTYLWDPRQFHSMYNNTPLPDGKPAIIGVAQFQPEPGEFERNLGRMKDLLGAPLDGADLVVFPELALSGSPSSPEQAQAMAEDVLDDPAITSLRELAKESNKYLVTTLVESEDGRYFHTALMVGPEGVRGKYRKVHLSGSERSWATPGDLGFPVFDLDLGRVGLLSGDDILFPEAAMCLASWGCDLICVPAALQSPRAVGLGETQVPLPHPAPRGDDPTHFLAWRVRAEQCSTYLAFSNYCGDKYAGRSGIFGPVMETFPRHESVLSKDQEEAGYLSIDCSAPGSPVRSKEALRMRQPNLYGRLLTPSPTNAEVADR